MRYLKNANDALKTDYGNLTRSNTPGHPEFVPAFVANVEAGTGARPQISNKTSRKSIPVDRSRPQCERSRPALRCGYLARDPTYPSRTWLHLQKRKRPADQRPEDLAAH